MARDRYKIYRQNYPHFVTFTFTHWLPLLGFTNIAVIMLNALRFHQKERSLKIYGWVFMENHIHMVIRSAELSKTIHSIKSFTAHQIIAELQSMHHEDFLTDLYWGKAFHKTSQTFQVWCDGFHPEEIGSREMMNSKIDYIHNNPVKRGYVREAMDWRYSSAGAYAGLTDSLLEVCTKW